MRLIFMSHALVIQAYNLCPDYNIGPLPDMWYIDTGILHSAEAVYIHVH